jgi:hypothetical protein
VTLTGTLQNQFRFPLASASVELSGPGDWGLTATTDTSFEDIDTQETADLAWELTAPDDADGEYTVSGTVTYATTTDQAEYEIEGTVVVFDAGEVPQEGLEAYFSFDGDTALNQATGTEAAITGDPTTGADGVLGSAWEFTVDGSRTSTADAVTSGEDLPLNGEEATVACWINVTDHEPFGRLFQVGGDVATNTVDAPGHEIVFDDQSDALYIYAKGGVRRSRCRRRRGTSSSEWSTGPTHACTSSTRRANSTPRP